MSDEIDIANERAQGLLDNIIAEHRYRVANAPADPNAGRCRYCNNKLDDGRNYCDEHCRDDHWKQICAEARRGNRK